MAFFNRLFGKGAASSQEKPEAPGPALQAKANAAPKDARLDQPLPADTWLAFKGAHRDPILMALGMKDLKPCAWEEGIRGSMGPDALFVTLPVNGCNLVFGNALPDLAYRSKTAPWLTTLGAVIPEVYAFSAQQNVQVFAFAKVAEGQMARFYAAAQGSVRVNRGGRSDGEEALDFTLPSNDDELFEPAGLTVPSVEVIRALSNYWCVDPAQAVGVKGLLGKVDRI